MQGTLQKRLCGLWSVHFLFHQCSHKSNGNPFSLCLGTPRGVKRLGSVASLPQGATPSSPQAQQHHRDASLDLNAVHTPGSEAFKLLSGTYSASNPISLHKYSRSLKNWSWVMKREMTKQGQAGSNTVLEMWFSSYQELWIHGDGARLRGGQV